MKLKGNVLVTGGAGYIGVELVNQLLEFGYGVTVLDKKDYQLFNKGVRYIQGDLQNAARCVMSCANQDYVVHLGGKPRIPESFVNPDAYFDDNVVGTRNILTAASAVGVSKFIFASSSSVYGNNPTPHKPYHKPDPLNYYAMTKLFGEHLCKQYKNMFDLNYNILRFFTVYSVNQPSDNEGGLMIGKFARLAKEDKALTIHGDGHFKRDYIHVNDVVSGIITSLESKVKNEIFNLGSGENISVNEVVDIIREFKPDVKTVNLNQPRGYAIDTLADISKARKLLGWAPEVNQREGIKATFKEILK